MFTGDFSKPFLITFKCYNLFNYLKILLFNLRIKLQSHCLSVFIVFCSSTNFCALFLFIKLGLPSSSVVFGEVRFIGCSTTSRCE